MHKKLFLFLLIGLSLMSCVTMSFAQTFRLTITSSIPGASVYVDGNYVGTTPVVYQATRGAHQFRVSLEGYKDSYQNINVTGNRVLSFQLQKDDSAPQTKTFRLTISSNVRDARIYIDGGSMNAQTPAALQVSEGRHEIKLTAPGYQDSVQNINLTGDLVLNFQMKKAVQEYTLSVTSNVARAKVYVNNAERGTTPLKISLEEDTYTIEVKATGYNDYSSTVRLNRDTTINAKLEAQKRIYSLTITSNVRQSKAAINGEEQKNFVPLSIPLEEGRYTITVTARGYLPYEVTIVLNRDTKIDAVLRVPEPTVRIIIPEGILDSSKRNPENQIDVYVDGRKQKEFEFTVTRGWHKIRIVSGGLAWEKQINFQDGKIYTIKFIFDMETSEGD